MSEPDSPIILDSNIPDWIRLARARQSLQKTELQMGTAERLNSSLVGSPHSSLQLGLHPHFGHSAHRRLPLAKSRTCLVSGTERHQPGRKEHGNGRTRRAGEALLAPEPALPSEMVASLMSLHPLWTQRAPPAGDTGKAGSCCGLLSTGNRLKLFFFTAVL